MLFAQLDDIVNLDVKKCHGEVWGGMVQNDNKLYQRDGVVMKQQAQGGVCVRFWGTVIRNTILHDIMEVYNLNR